MISSNIFWKMEEIWLEMTILQILWFEYIYYCIDSSIFVFKLIETAYWNLWWYTAWMWDMDYFQINLCTCIFFWSHHKINLYEIFWSKFRTIYSAVIFIFLPVTFAYRHCFSQLCASTRIFAWVEDARDDKELTRLNLNKIWVNFNSWRY